MAIFGWLFLLLASIWASFFYLIVCWNTLGKYNIGGVPNKLWEKILVIFLGFFLFFWWSKVFDWSPFVLSISSN